MSLSEAVINRKGMNDLGALKRDGGGEKGTNDVVLFQVCDLDK